MSTACFSSATAARCLVGQFLAAAAMIGMGDSGVSLSAESLPRAQQRSILSEGKAQAAFQPRGPAQFFTINEVNSGTNSSARAIRLSFDYNEPFGLSHLRSVHSHRGTGEKARS